MVMKFSLFGIAPTPDLWYIFDVEKTFLTQTKEAT